MPTWGWFIVALVLIDAAVLCAWLLARKGPAKKSPDGGRSMLSGLDETARDEIYRLVGEKKKIHAIKLFRERTGARLKDAKDAIEAVERGTPLPSSAPVHSLLELHDAPWHDLVPRLQNLKSEGKTIQAIKLLRERTGLTLREAKTAVDQL